MHGQERRERNRAHTIPPPHRLYNSGLVRARVRGVFACVRAVYVARSGRSNDVIEQQTGRVMSAQKITDEQWAEARKRYETEPGLGLGKVAQLLDCSKTLVARKSREGRWQKGIGIPAQVWNGASAREAKVTENAVHSPTRNPGVHAAEPSTHAPSRVVGEVFVAPAATSGVTPLKQGMTTDVTPAPAHAYADEINIPDGLDPFEREEYVKQAIVNRQKAINARHLREMQAARSKLYESLKKAGTKDGPGVALASQRNVAALLALQGGEMDAELQRVKLEVHEFVGKPLKPTPCRIVVHMLPGHQIVGGAEVYGPHAVVQEIVDV